MRLVAFFNVPSALGLLVLAEPISSLIYERGRFGPGDTAGTAQALACYALGLYAYSGVKVLAPAFYALDEARVAVAGSLLGMAANLALNLALQPVLGYRGVALGTSAAAWMNFSVLAIAFRRRHGGLAGARLVRHLGRVGASSVAMALAAWAAHRALAAEVSGRGTGAQLLLALVPVAVGALVYFGAARLLRVRELGEVWEALRRRRGEDRG
jgi:putative peptidoglycan lipid II flippase